MPSGNRRYVDVLDRESEKVWHQKLAPITEMKGDLVGGESEVVERIEGNDGGPCRGRTYGPLIKSVKWLDFAKARCCNSFLNLPLRNRGLCSF